MNNSTYKSKHLVGGFYFKGESRTITSLGTAPGRQARHRGSSTGAAAAESFHLIYRVRQREGVGCGGGSTNRNGVGFHNTHQGHTSYSLPGWNHSHSHHRRDTMPWVLPLTPNRRKQKQNYPITKCFLYIYFLFFQDRLSLWSSGCPGAYSADQAGL